MSIESFDVEPVDHRRLLRWLLGLVAAVTGVLAIIGWPLPAVPGRYVPSDAWERTTALIEAWWTHDGWRMSGASWFWGGVAIGATTGAIAICVGKERTGRKAWLPFDRTTDRPAVRMLLDGSVVELFTSAGRSVTTRVYPEQAPPWSVEAPPETVLWDLERAVAR